MRCSSRIIKNILLIFNLICVLGGLAMIILGIIAKVNITETAKSISGPSVDFSSNTSKGMIVLGSIVFVIGFFGCWGALKENTVILKTYAVILLNILVSQVVLATLILLTYDDAFINSRKPIFITSGIVFISMAAVELVGAIFAFSLSNSISKSQGRVA